MNEILSVLICHALPCSTDVRILLDLCFFFFHFGSAIQVGDDNLWQSTALRSNAFAPKITHWISFKCSKHGRLTVNSISSCTHILYCNDYRPCTTVVQDALPVAVICYRFIQCITNALSCPYEQRFYITLLSVNPILGALFPDVQARIADGYKFHDFARELISDVIYEYGFFADNSTTSVGFDVIKCLAHASC